MNQPINVTETKVFPFKKATGKMKAFAQVILNGSLKLGGLKVVEGQNGLFVSYPSEKGKDGAYYSLYNPITKESRIAIQDAVLDGYQKTVTAAAAA